VAAPGRNIDSLSFDNFLSLLFRQPRDEGLKRREIKVDQSVMGFPSQVAAGLSDWRISNKVETESQLT
jgi:hypothetical protein